MQISVCGHVKVNNIFICLSLTLAGHENQWITTINCDQERKNTENTDPINTIIWIKLIDNE